MTIEPMPVASPENAVPKAGCAIAGSVLRSMEQATGQIFGMVCPLALQRITVKFCHYRLSFSKPLTHWTTSARLYKGVLLH